MNQENFNIDILKKNSSIIVISKNINNSRETCKFFRDILSQHNKLNGHYFDSNLLINENNLNHELLSDFEYLIFDNCIDPKMTEYFNSIINEHSKYRIIAIQQLPYLKKSIRNKVGYMFIYKNTFKGSLFRIYEEYLTNIFYNYNKFVDLIRNLDNNCCIVIDIYNKKIYYFNPLKAISLLRIDNFIEKANYLDISDYSASWEDDVAINNKYNKCTII